MLIGTSVCLDLCHSMVNTVRPVKRWGRIIACFEEVIALWWAGRLGGRVVPSGPAPLFSTTLPPTPSLLAGTDGAHLKGARSWQTWTTSAGLWPFTWQTRWKVVASAYKCVRARSHTHTHTLVNTCVALNPVITINVGNVHVCKNLGYIC